MGMPVEVCFMIKRIHQVRERMRESRERRGGMEGDKEQRNTLLVDVKGPGCVEASGHKNTH